MSIFKDSLKTIILSALIILLAGIAYGWTEPGQSPPGGNLSAPITISSGGQTKSGNLVVNSLATANGLIVQNGKVGIGTPEPIRPLHLYSPSGSSEIIMEVADSPADYRKWNLGVGYSLSSSRKHFFIRQLNDAGTGGDMRLFINGNTGNVGIGTPEPNVAGFKGRVLTIGNGKEINNSLELYGWSAGGSQSVGTIAWTNAASSAPNKQIAGIMATAHPSPVEPQSGNLIFLTALGGGPPSERMRIGRDGNVTISNTLTVKGGLVIKSLVSSDPASPVDGEMWTRQDSEHTYNNGTNSPPYGNFCGANSNPYALDSKSIQRWIPEYIVWDIHPTQGQEDIENGHIWFRFYRHGQNGCCSHSAFHKFQIGSSGSFPDPNYNYSGGVYTYHWKLNCNANRTSCGFDFLSQKEVSDSEGNSSMVADCGWNTITFNPQHRYLSDLSLKIYKNGKVWKSVFTPQ